MWDDAWWNLIHFLQRGVFFLTFVNTDAFSNIILGKKKNACLYPFGMPLNLFRMTGSGRMFQMTLGDSLITPTIVCH